MTAAADAVIPLSRGQSLLLPVRQKSLASTRQQTPQTQHLCKAAVRLSNNGRTLELSDCRSLLQSPPHLRLTNSLETYSLDQTLYCFTISGQETMTQLAFVNNYTLGITRHSPLPVAMLHQVQTGTEPQPLFPCPHNVVFQSPRP